MIPNLRQVVRLSGGSVVLEAWGDDVADAYLLDLLTLTATLSAVREHWASYERADLTAQAWGPFWRLVQASLPPGMTLPRPITWKDRLTLLEAMHELNALDEAEGKLKASAQKGQATLALLKATVKPNPTGPTTGPMRC